MREKLASRVSHVDPPSGSGSRAGRRLTERARGFPSLPSEPRRVTVAGDRVENGDALAKEKRHDNGGCRVFSSPHAGGADRGGDHQRLLRAAVGRRRRHAAVLRGEQTLGTRGEQRRGRRPVLRPDGAAPQPIRADVGDTGASPVASDPQIFLSRARLASYIVSLNID